MHAVHACQYVHVHVLTSVKTFFLYSVHTYLRIGTEAVVYCTCGDKTIQDRDESPLTRLSSLCHMRLGCPKWRDSSTG